MATIFTDYMGYANYVGACYNGESNPVIILRTGDRAASIGISESSGNSPRKACVFQNHSGPPEKIGISGYAGHKARRREIAV